VDFVRCPCTETSPGTNPDLLGLNHQEFSQRLLECCAGGFNSNHDVTGSFHTFGYFFPLKQL
jgi:hypothetical protein